jgi:hypothetical protein
VSSFEPSRSGKTVLLPSARTARVPATAVLVQRQKPTSLGPSPLAIPPFILNLDRLEMQIYLMVKAPIDRMGTTRLCQGLGLPVKALRLGTSVGGIVDPPIKVF